MGWSTEYCSLCGLPLNVNNLYNNVKDTYYNLPKWIYTCTILFNNNKTIHNINWRSEYEKYYIHVLIGGKPYGFIVIHCDCWKYIKKEKNIKLKYSDFPFVEKMYSSDDYIFYKFKVDYKKISNLQGQDFNHTKYINYGYSYESPLKNKVLGNFIINIFNQLNIKADRVGPRVSATLYKNNDLLIGSDNNIWEINNKKWIKTKNIKTFTFSSDSLNNKILLKNLEKYFSYDRNLYDTYKDAPISISELCYIPRLGEVSDCGLILKDIKIKFTNNSCKIKFIILYNDKGTDKLNKMIENNFGLF